MEGRGAFLRVGALIMAGFALLVGLVLFLSGQRYDDGKEFESYFKESVQGLEVGAPVKYLGVTLGKVTSIGLVSAEYSQEMPAAQRSSTFRQVFVRYVINPKKVGRLPDTNTAVGTGLRARLASQGLTGLSYIELDFVDPQQFPAETAPWQPHAEYIPSIPSTLLQVQDAAQEFLAKLNRIDFDKLSDAATGFVGNLNASLKQGDVHIALTDADALLTALRGAVQAADLPGLTGDLKRTSASARELIDSKETRAMIANLSAAAARLPPLIAALEATARRADSGTADVQQSLAPILRDAQAAVANLRDVTANLRQYPAQLLLGGPPPKPEQNR